jgi:hypothetical protein
MQIVMTVVPPIHGQQLRERQTGVVQLLACRQCCHVLRMPDRLFASVKPYTVSIVALVC